MQLVTPLYVILQVFFANIWRQFSQREKMRKLILKFFPTSCQGLFRTFVVDIKENPVFYVRIKAIMHLCSEEIVKKMSCEELAILHAHLLPALRAFWLLEKSCDAKVLF